MPPKAAALWVDRLVHAAACLRLDLHIVEGPREQDCSVFRGGLGRMGAVAFTDTAVVSGCAYVGTDTPWRARITGHRRRMISRCVTDPDARYQHVVARTKRDNMIRMARMGRGGGRRSPLHRDGRGRRRTRSLALGEAVRDGWGSGAGARRVTRGLPIDVMVAVGEKRRLSPIRITRDRPG